MSSSNKKRYCISCGSLKTSLLKGKYERWYRRNNRDYICHKCRLRLFDHPKWNPIYASRKIVFKGKAILLKHTAKRGICSICNKGIGDEYINKEKKRAKIRRTSMHHVEYIDDNPLAYTIELCNSCHTKEHWKLKKEASNICNI